MSTFIVNALTVDLEDYYMVSAFERVVTREDWGAHESRIERNTHRVLDMLSDATPRLPRQNDQNALPHVSKPKPEVKATFFCLGWIAERYPHLIRDIVERGHEVASHSYDHKLIYEMTPNDFREDVRRSKKILADITGREVIGYRAPSYSITEKSFWALRILTEEGYRYDSSIFPIHHDRYGIPSAPRFPFRVNLNDGFQAADTAIPDFSRMQPWEPGQDVSKNRCLVEFPISTVQLFGMNVPIGGGGYMRLLPYRLMKRGLDKINNDEQRPFVFYLHPWELDPEQPRITGVPLLSRFRHYINLDETAVKMKSLLSDFSFSTMADVIGLG